MKQVAITGERQAVLLDKPDLQPFDNWVVVKIHAAPMCTEYKRYLSGEPTEILGHEAAGEVVAVAQPGRVKVGDRVVAMPLYGCGVCPLCVVGRLHPLRKYQGLRQNGTAAARPGNLRPVPAQAGLAAAPDPGRRFLRTCLVGLLWARALVRRDALDGSRCLYFYPDHGRRPGWPGRDRQRPLPRRTRDRGRTGALARRARQGDGRRRGARPARQADRQADSRADRGTRRRLLARLRRQHASPNGSASTPRGAKARWRSSASARIGSPSVSAPI